MPWMHVDPWRCLSAYRPSTSSRSADILCFYQPPFAPLPLGNLDSPEVITISYYFEIIPTQKINILLEVYMEKLKQVTHLQVTNTA